MIQNFCKNISFGNRGYYYLYNKKKNKIILISGKNSNYNYLKKQIKKVNAGEINHIIVKNERESFNHIEKLSKNLNKRNIAYLIVLGGGSIIDFSKHIFVKLSKPPKFIIFPSLIGSGAETSISSIINTKKLKKITINNKFLPDAVLYDKNLIKDCKESQILMGLLDAITHCIESTLTINSNFYLDFLSKNTINYFVDNFSQIFTKNKSTINYDILSIISFNGGLAQSNSGTGICHALAHSAEKICNEKHSKCVSFFILKTLKYLSIKNKKEFKKLNPKLLLCIKKIFNRLNSEVDFSNLENIVKYQKKLDELMHLAYQDQCWKLYKYDIDKKLIIKCLKL